MSQEKYCTDDIKHIMGVNIMCVRKDAGLSVIQLAEACKCNRITIHNIESGRYAAGYNLLYKIAAACGVEARELLPTSKELNK